MGMVLLEIRGAGSTAVSSSNLHKAFLNESVEQGRITGEGNYGWKSGNKEGGKRTEKKEESRALVTVDGGKCCKWRTQENHKETLKNKGILTSGCYRHIEGTSLPCCLQDFNGGLVALDQGVKAILLLKLAEDDSEKYLHLRIFYEVLLMVSLQLSYDDEATEAEFKNLENSVNVSPNPHQELKLPLILKTLILGAPTSAVQQEQS
ncbi:hypothetical protein Tco_0651666 [Tanacetum coccineum]|uniref:Uncharacterized protein n=1 Tax=Tanacetum coccineum TaxID=301880 RepID=A0ABQ4WVF4_9ASTR